MIEVNRSLIRHVRTVLRRSVMAESPRGPWPVLRCRAGPEGLCIQAAQGDVAAFYHDPKPQPPAELAFSASVLGEIDGRAHGQVRLGPGVEKKLQAAWQEDGVPRVITFDKVEHSTELPELPKHFTPMPATLLQALAEAVRTTAKSAVKPALTRLQLRGNGSVVATDGRQLLVQGGFHFPWKGSVLIPRLAVFDGPDLGGRGQPIAVGRTKQHVAFRIGLWTFVVRIDVHSPFPKVNRVIPDAARVVSRLVIDTRDAETLFQALPKLSRPSDGDNHPVTLDLCSPPVLRASNDGGQVTEIPLSYSTVKGRAVRFCTDRRLLYRALQLSFRELHVVNGDTPIVCRDAQRVYMWMPLSESGVTPSAPANAHI